MHRFFKLALFAIMFADATDTDPTQLPTPAPTLSPTLTNTTLPEGLGTEGSPRANGTFFEEHFLLIILGAAGAMFALILVGMVCYRIKSPNYNQRESLMGNLDARRSTWARRKTQDVAFTYRGSKLSGPALGIGDGGLSLAPAFTGVVEGDYEEDPDSDDSTHPDSPKTPRITISSYPGEQGDLPNQWTL